MVSPSHGRWSAYNRWLALTASRVPNYFRIRLYNRPRKHAKTSSPSDSQWFWTPGHSSVHQGFSISDKFFFKGRQDARQHHTTYGGFQTGASQKSGSKKYPLALVVTSEARKREIEARVAGAGLHADITLDTREGAVESITALTAVLDRGATVTVAKVPSRNDPCRCGSGLKFKKCCG